MKSALVTGGAGFIGSHVVDRLLADGWRVRVFDDFSTGSRANLDHVRGDIELVEGSVCDSEAVNTAAQGVEAIFHLAAMGSVPRSVDQPRAAHDNNITGTFNVLEAARAADVPRVIYSASSSAYGDDDALPSRESATPAPLSPYAVSKLAGEHYLRVYASVYGLATVSLRYFNVFGPRQDPNSQYAAVIPAFVTRMVRGEAPVVYGDGEQSRDFCFVSNVVDANLCAANALRLTGEVVNIACGERTSLNEMLKRINAALGVNIAAHYEPERAGDVKHSQADITRAKEVIGYVPRMFFAEGLSQTITYYKQLGTQLTPSSAGS